jgi:hypothetical protein
MRGEAVSGYRRTLKVEAGVSSTLNCYAFDLGPRSYISASAYPQNYPTVLRLQVSLHFAALNGSVSVD